MGIFDFGGGDFLFYLLFYATIKKTLRKALQGDNSAQAN